LRSANAMVTNIFFILVYNSFGAGVDTGSDSRIKIDARLRARRIRIIHFAV
jgi:hypothetical protein